MSNHLPASIETVYSHGREVPEGLTIGRCEHEHAVAWPTGTLSLADATCPIHEGSNLYQTTRILGRRFYVMTREAAKAQAAARKAARKAAQDERAAAGLAKLGKAVVPGDIVRAFGRNWVRVISVGPDPAVKARLQVTAARLAEDVTQSLPWTVVTFTIRKAEEFDLSNERELTWADQDSAAAALNLLRDELETHERMAPTYRKWAQGRNRAGGWDLKRAAEHEAGAVRVRELLELLEAAAQAPTDEILAPSSEVSSSVGEVTCR